MDKGHGVWSCVTPMRVPVPLSEAFGAPFEDLLTQFLLQKEYISEEAVLKSPRFLMRSIVPHIKKLSTLFNRIDPEAGVAHQAEGLEPYWKESSHPANLRLAYFIYFMPSNLYRIASIWTELKRLGFQWGAKGNLRAIELGAGPASGACGIAAGEHYAPVGLPLTGNWALLEQDKATLELGSEWAQAYFPNQGFPDWGTRTFHRKIDFARGLLPPSAPKFNLWVMSYFLNEAQETPKELAEILIKSWENHLDDEGVVILAEPALKLQSRKLLELRKELLLARERLNAPWLQILLPCLGHQSCGALAEAEDWCHEEVTWWRPPYFRGIDKMAGLDRKTLPFSYLVIVRSKRSLEQILPALGASKATKRERLVSPAHGEGKDQEFFVCGQDGKRRARYRARPDEAETLAAELTRGDILTGVKSRGDVHSSRIEKIESVL
ncbi:small ribosomal subunit Rsm22 family protein [Bdellovibrionota bacterium FG-1]